MNSAKGTQGPGGGVKLTVVGPVGARIPTMMGLISERPVIPTNIIGSLLNMRRVSTATGISTDCRRSRLVTPGAAH